jgi:hypothetical protein
MDTADWDCVFVADLAVKRARLSKADVVRFGGRATADDARLARHELTVLLVAQTNGLRRHAASSDDCRCRSGRLRTAEGFAVLLQVLDAGVIRDPRARLSFLDRRKPLPEAGFESFSVGRGQGVLRREGLMDPSRRPRRQI